VTQILLSARGLSHRGLFEALDLDVRAGELVALTGPNGSGKSTLLRLLLGLERPERGSIRRAAGLRVGYMPQLDPSDPALPFPALSVVQQGRATRARAAEALDLVGYRAPHSRRYSLLSGGERRRVLLARALAAKPGLLALDEPTAGIDVEGESALFDLLLVEVRSRGTGLLWVGHGASSLERVADRQVRLGGGLR